MHENSVSVNQTGETDQRKIIIDALFLTLHLAYPDFYRGYSEEEITQAKRLWRLDLRSITDQTIEQALEHVREHFLDRAPNSGQFREFCRKRNPAHDPQSHQRTTPQIEHQPIHPAWPATRAAFAKRILDPTHFGMPAPYSEPLERYDGPVDVQHIADQVNLPRSASLNDHRIAWTNLRHAFDQAVAEPYTKQE